MLYLYRIKLLDQFTTIDAANGRKRNRDAAKEHWRRWGKGVAFTTLCEVPLRGKVTWRVAERTATMGLV